MFNHGLFILLEESITTLNKQLFDSCMDEIRKEFFRFDLQKAHCRLANNVDIHKRKYSKGKKSIYPYGYYHPGMANDICRNVNRGRLVKKAINPDYLYDYNANNELVLLKASYHSNYDTTTLYEINQSIWKFITYRKHNEDRQALFGVVEDELLFAGISLYDEIGLLEKYINVGFDVTKYDFRISVINVEMYKQTNEDYERLEVVEALPCLIKNGKIPVSKAEMMVKRNYKGEYEDWSSIYNYTTFEI